MADTYVAVEDIFVARGVRAHVKGEVVPAENVAANGWESKVAKSSTKAAKEAQV